MPLTQAQPIICFYLGLWIFREWCKYGGSIEKLLLTAAAAAKVGHPNWKVPGAGTWLHLQCPAHLDCALGELRSLLLFCSAVLSMWLPSLKWLLCLKMAADLYPSHLHSRYKKRKIKGQKGIPLPTESGPFKELSWKPHIILFSLHLIGHFCLQRSLGNVIGAHRHSQ